MGYILPFVPASSCCLLLWALSHLLYCPLPFVLCCRSCLVTLAFAPLFSSDVGHVSYCRLPLVLCRWSCPVLSPPSCLLPWVTSHTVASLLSSTVGHVSYCNVPLVFYSGSCLALLPPSCFLPWVMSRTVSSLLSFTTQTAVVWSCFPLIRSGQNHLARHSERGKKTRRTKEEVGR